MPYQPIGKYEGSRGFARKTDFKRPVTFYDRVRFVGDDSTMEMFGGVLTGDISADLLTLGTLVVDRIAVGSITADRSVIGSPDNLIPNPGFEADFYSTTDPHVYDTGGGGSWSINTTTVRSGARSAQHNATGQSGSDYIFLGGALENQEAHYAATEGDEFHVEAYARGSLSSPGVQPQLNIRFYDETPSVLSTALTIWGISGFLFNQKITVSAVAPVGTAYVAFYVKVGSGGANGELLLFDDFYARRRVSTLVIEDQAVDIERMLDPVFVATDSGTTSTSWTTTLSKKHTETLNVPSWVGTLDVYGYASGTKVWVTGQWIEPRFQVGAAVVGVNRTQRVVNHVGAVFAHGVHTVASPGSTISLECWGDVLTTTETSVASVVKYTATGIR